MKPLPLEGKTVVNTRPAHQSKDFSERLTDLGAKVLALPAISLRSNVDDEHFRAAITSLTDFDWVIFTSVNGVQAVLEVMSREGVPLNQLFERKLAAIGPATRDALLEAGAKEVVMPEAYVSEEILPVLGDISGLNILLPRADIARKDLIPLLEQAGAKIVQVSAYKIESNTDPLIIDQIKTYPDSFCPDFLTFTSSSTVRGFEGLAKAAGRTDWLKNGKLVAIGPITASTIDEIGLSADLVASDYTTDGIIQMLMEGVKA